MDGLPGVIETIAKINPLSYGVDGLRYAFTGISHFNIWLDFGVVLIVALVINLIGTYMFSKIEI